MLKKIQTLGYHSVTIVQHPWPFYSFNWFFCMLNTSYTGDQNRRWVFVFYRDYCFDVRKVPIQKIYFGLHYSALNNDIYIFYDVETNVIDGFNAVYSVYVCYYYYLFEYDTMDTANSQFIEIWFYSFVRQSLLQSFHLKKINLFWNIVSLSICGKSGLAPTHRTTSLLLGCGRWLKIWMQLASFHTTQLSYSTYDIWHC